MNTKRIALSLAVVAASTLGVMAQRVKLEPDQRYLLLSTYKGKTMQKELDEVSAKGFRVMMASANGPEMVLFLEKVSEPPNTFKYLYLATFREKTLSKELTNAANEGYRIMPHTVMYKTGFTIFNNETVVLMEKQPNATKKYEYLVVFSGSTGDLQKAVSEAAEKDFKLAGLVVGNGNRVIMEKESSLQP